MVLVFILCTIIAIIALLICMILLSTLKLEIKNFELSNMKQTEGKISKQYQFIISLYLFNKIKWISIHLNDKRMRRMYTKMQLEKIDMKKIEKDFKIEDLKYIRQLQPQITYLNFNIKIGVEDVILTSFIICILSTIISITLPHMIKKYQKDKYQYKVVPLYINKNVYEIKIDCIIETKLVHIINIIYIFIKKRREKKNEQRTSNRRSYGYSYE